MKNCSFFLLGIGFSLGLAHAAEPVASSDQLPRIPPTEADKAIHTFRIKKGFAMELAASELKRTGAFKIGGCLDLKLKKKPARPARKGVNPFTKEPCVFKAKPASKTVRCLPMKKLKVML